MYSTRIKDLLSQMTLKEKVGQMIQLHPNAYYQIKKNISSNHLLTGPFGEVLVEKEDLNNIGSILTVNNAKEIITLQKEHLESSRLKIPLLFMFDVIHGYKTIFPINLGMSASWNLDLVEEASHVAAVEAGATGIHVNFAPMCDLVRDPRWGRVMESPGEDPYLNELMVAATVKGFQQESFDNKYSVATCVKHFAAYGAVEAGLDYNVVDLSERWLREYYLTAYKAALNAGSPMVMTSFNVYDGVPSTINKHLMRDILRDEWGFEGVLISDWDATIEALVIGAAEDEKDCAKKAVEAGLDMEMTSPLYYMHLEKLVESGEVSESLIDDAVLRVLHLKETLGLFENPYRDASTDDETKTHLCDDHRVKARKAAEESCVLLKNDGVLPFSKDVKKIAIIGPLADSNAILGWWRAIGKPEDTISLKNGIENLLGDSVSITTALGCDYKDMKSDQIEAAVATAKEADVVILALGEHQDMSGEAGNRGEIGLPGLQQKLADAILDLDIPTAVVLFSGRPLAIDALDHKAPAILEAWFPGTEGGNAIANILFGDVNPSGKITMTFPRFLGQVPVYYNRHQVGRPTPSEDYKHGELFSPISRYFSNYLDMPNAPLYPFGYGLSYTQFKYDKLELSSKLLTDSGIITVSVDITNCGPVDGYEIAQLYIRDIKASVARPLKELKAFEKLHLKAGQRKTVTFDISPEMLKFYKQDMSFGYEYGDFEVFVGTHSDSLLKESFKLVK